MLALLIISILFYSAWFTTLIFIFGPWWGGGRITTPDDYGPDIYICWPVYTIPTLLIHQLIELILLRCCKRYHVTTGRIFHAIWILHGVASLITTSIAAVGIPYFRRSGTEPGLLLCSFVLLFNAITLLVHGRTFYVYKDFTLSASSDEEAALKSEENLMS